MTSPLLLSNKDVFIEIQFSVCLFHSLTAPLTFADRNKDVHIIPPPPRLSSINEPSIPQEDMLQNSNKIGLGYNLLYGSPICYTGTCQMEAFAQPIFKLSYTRKAQGSCTSKLIPDDVHIDCLPSVEVHAGTEVINTLDQLQHSIMNGIHISADGKIKNASFSYQHSSQTRYMIDNTIKTNTTVLYTSAKVSTIKLSMYEPFMILSDQFRHAILNIPCCNHPTAEVENYIYEYIFNYYGFTFVTQLMLGGIAQQNIFINNDELINIENRDYQKSHEAKVEFFLSLGMKHSESFNQTKHNEFMKHVTKSYATTLGGDSSIHSSFSEWSKTVSSNPIVTKLTVKYIFDLLNVKRFPDDPNIIKKKQLIENALNKYIQNPVFCYSNCSGHGVCHATNYFQFGMCKCNDNWSAFDCSVSVTTTSAPIELVPSGTLCGLRKFVKCDDNVPETSCPSQWQQTPEMRGVRNLYYREDRGWFGGKTTKDYWIPVMFTEFCLKSYTNSETGKTGTICGMAFGNLLVKCDGRNPNSEPCPVGYRRGEAKYYFGFVDSAVIRVCYKINNMTSDASGTLCGLTNALSSHGGFRVLTSGPLLFNIPCNDYYPGRGACPPGYSLNSGFESYESHKYHVSVCSKI